MARPPVNAVFILWLRQLKLYSRSRARMVGALGQPTLFLLSLGFGLGPTFARAGRGDYVQFLAPGIVSIGILFAAVFSGIGIIWDRDQETFGGVQAVLTLRSARPRRQSPNAWREMPAPLLPHRAPPAHCIRANCRGSFGRAAALQS